MRATEFLHFLNHPVSDEVVLSHFEYRDPETGKILDKYKKIKRQYRRKKK